MVLSLATVPLQAAPTNDAVTITTYSVAPIAGAIPAGAVPLTTVTYSETISEGGFVPTLIAAPPDGATLDAPATSLDYTTVNGNQGNDPHLEVPSNFESRFQITLRLVVGFTPIFEVSPGLYPTPDAVQMGPLPGPATLTAPAGSHALLSLNGGTPATSVTATETTDILTLVEDGTGQPQTFQIGLATLGFTNSLQVQAVPAISAAPLGSSFDATSNVVYALTSGGNALETSYLGGDDEAGMQRPVSADGLVSAGGMLYQTATYGGNGVVLGVEPDTTRPGELLSLPGQTVSLGGLGGLGGLAELATDTSGNIYALTGQGVVEFPPHLAGPAIATLSGSATTLTSAQGIGVDGSGNVYVAQISPGTGIASAIDVFAPLAPGTQNAAPIRTISIVQPSSNMSPVTTANQIGLAVDSAGDAFVVQGQGPIIEYFAGRNGTLAPDVTFAQSYGFTAAVIGGGTLYASSATSPFPILGYTIASPATAPMPEVPSQPALAVQLAI